MTNGSGKWQIAFWVVTGFTIILSLSSGKGFLYLNDKIALAADKLTLSKEKDVEKIYEKIDKVTDKLDRVHVEQREFRSEQRMVNKNILVKLDDIKRKQH